MPSSLLTIVDGISHTPLVATSLAETVWTDSTNPWQAVSQLLLHQPPHLFVEEVSSVLYLQAKKRIHPILQQELMT